MIASTIHRMIKPTQKCSRLSRPLKLRKMCMKSIWFRPQLLLVAELTPLKPVPTSERSVFRLSGRGRSGEFGQDFVCADAVACLGVERFEDPIALGADDVLHLHRLDHEQKGLAGADVVALDDFDGDDEGRALARAP